VLIIIYLLIFIILTGHLRHIICLVFLHGVEC